VQLQANNSGAWKTIARFDAGDVEADRRIKIGAILIRQADSTVTFRIATVEALPSVLMRMNNDQWVEA
ncbi:MAG: hypothetical protein ACKVOT_13945, partial [Polaromonas sp.]